MSEKRINVTDQLERNWVHKPFLLITGFPRSGTSFLTRALSLCGLYLGGLESLTSHEWSAPEHNLRGTWEHRKLKELITRTENDSGVWRYQLPTKISISAELGNDVRSAIEELVNHPSLASGFKGHIMCVSAWKDYLPKNLVVVGIFRHPLSAAESAKNAGFEWAQDQKKTLSLWKAYNQELLSVLERHEGFLLNFDWAGERLLSEVRLIARKLGLVDADLSKWYTEELRHSEKTYPSDNLLADDITSVYSQLVERAEKNAGVKVREIRRSPEELMEIVEAMLSETQASGDYFSGLHEKLLMENAEMRKVYRLKDTTAFKSVVWYKSYVARHFPQGSKRRGLLNLVLAPVRRWLRQTTSEKS